MNKKAFGWMVCWFAFLLLSVSIGALAQNPTPTPTQFSGVIDAYTPQTGSTGPYEIHGPWSLQFIPTSSSSGPGKASFTAALNMELSDGWVLTENNGNFDPNGRGAHTHHVTLVNVDITRLTNGFQLSGTATITVNGNPAPISPSPLVITVTGGSDVKLSNITMTFGAPGSRHFGSEPLPGVVQSVK